MTWTIDEALSHELVTVEAVIVKFRLGIAPTVITARIIRETPIKCDPQVSHKIKTPCQPNSYLPAFRDCASPGAAVHELVLAFTQEYTFAHKKGYQPDESWLVSNEYFDRDEFE